MKQECPAIKEKCFESYLLLVYLLLNKKSNLNKHPLYTRPSRNTTA